jgi:hypothetical protein
MTGGFKSSDIDTSRPHTARMYDFYLNGRDNYAADRNAPREVLRAAPEIRAAALANQAFLGRAVRYLVRHAGIRQIIDIGTGIPAAGNVHEVAQQAAPGVRVAYVDNDPIVHVHADALPTGTGITSIVLADLREPEAISQPPADQGTDRLHRAGGPAPDRHPPLHHRWRGPSLAGLGSMPGKEGNLTGLDLLALVEERGEGVGDRAGEAPVLRECLGRDENQPCVRLPSGPVPGVERHEVLDVGGDQRASRSRCAGEDLVVRQ